MPFLIAFWKPIAALLLIVAVVAALAIAKHGYDERKRDEGRAEVQAKWDAAIAAQKVRELAAAKEADEFANRLEAKRSADFARLAKRAAALEARLAAVPVGPDLVGELRNTVRAANSTGTGEPAKADTAASGTTDGLAIVQWFDKVGELYRACRERQEAWVKWDDARVTQ